MKKIILIIAVIVIIIIAFFLGRDSVKDNNEESLDLDSIVEDMGLNDDSTNLNDDSTNMEQELKTEILEQGSGTPAKNGDTITVHYTGSLLDGTKFDSSVDRGEPFSFVLGQGRVIQGWEQGLLGSQKGTKMKLTIPPELGYGEAGTPGGPIPPNATLVFEIEVVGIDN